MTSNVRRSTRWLTVVFLVALGFVYLAAKIDFFRKFDPNNLSAYLTGHWLYWVTTVILVCLGFLSLQHGSAGDLDQRNMEQTITSDKSDR